MYDINGDGYVDDKDIATMLKFVFFVREMKEQDADGVFETSLTNDEFVEKMARDIIATYSVKQDQTLDLNEFKNVRILGLLGFLSEFFRCFWMVILKLE